MLIKSRVWFLDELKHPRMLWEGLFFMFWHADKSVYQRDVALKIASILVDLQTADSAWSNRQKVWLEAFLYIFSKHWDKVDNFRIDKYLLLVRNMLNSCFQVLKETDYKEADMQWFTQLLKTMLLDQNAAQGLLLQIVDVFVPEMGKVNPQVSLSAMS